MDQLKRIHDGSASLKTAIGSYEAELWPRAHEAVLKSRQAALDAHDWDALTVHSPSIGARIPPATA